jgi:hypothetical protein
MPFETFDFRTPTRHTRNHLHKAISKVDSALTAGADERTSSQVHSVTDHLHDRVDDLRWGNFIKKRNRNHPSAMPMRRKRLFSGTQGGGGKRRRSANPAIRRRRSVMRRRFYPRRRYIRRTRRRTMMPSMFKLSETKRIKIQTTGPVDQVSTDTDIINLPMPSGNNNPQNETEYLSTFKGNKFYLLGYKIVWLWRNQSTDSDTMVNWRLFHLDNQANTTENQLFYDVINGNWGSINGVTFQDRMKRDIISSRRRTGYTQMINKVIRLGERSDANAKPEERTMSIYIPLNKQNQIDRQFWHRYQIRQYCVDSRNGKGISDGTLLNYTYQIVLYYKDA